MHTPEHRTFSAFVEGKALFQALVEQRFEPSANKVYVFLGIRKELRVGKGPYQYELHEMESSDLFTGETAAHLKSISNMWEPCVLRYSTIQVHKEGNHVGSETGWEAIHFNTAHREYFNSLTPEARGDHLFDLWQAH